MPKFSPKLIVLARRLATDFSKAQKKSPKINTTSSFKATGLEAAHRDEKKPPENASASVVELAKRLLQETAKGSGEIPAVTAETLFLGPADGDSRDARFKRRVESVNSILVSKKEVEPIYRWVMEAAYEYAQALDLPKVTLAHFQRDILGQIDAA